MGQPVCTVEHRFTGWCYECEAAVGGSMVTGADPDICIEGKPICVDGSEGRGDCGHPCHAVGKSTVFKIMGKPVARVGDPVEGIIVGQLVSGSDFVFSD